MPPTTTTLFDTLRRALLAAALLLGLAACGPGTGGTGTGPIGATLGYAGGTSGSTAAPGIGCTGDCPQAALQLDAARVVLQAPCLRFVHDGAWTVDGGGLAVIDGSVQGVAARVTLRLQFSEASAASSQVSATLSDDTGRVLLGPVTLLRNDTLNTSPLTCPAQ